MGIESTLSTILAEAVRRVGSQSAFGRLIGRSQTWVYNALRDDTPLPAENVLTVEQATGISRHDLRPDVYGPAPASLAGGAERLEPAR